MLECGFCGTKTADWVASEMVDGVFCSEACASDAYSEHLSAEYADGLVDDFALGLL